MLSPAREDEQGHGAREVGVLVIGLFATERRSLLTMLEPLGLTVIEASSPAGALRRTLRCDFAVIVLDGRGDDDVNVATVGHLRAGTQTTTPVIVLATDEHVDLRFAAEPSVEVMTAPVGPAELRKRVSLYVELFEKTQSLIEMNRDLRRASADAADALAFELEMLDRMERLGRAETDIVSKVSHELRTPLTAVIGYVEILIDGLLEQLPSEQGRLLAIVDRKCQVLLALIEDLLTTGRVESGTLELAVGVVDVEDLVERVRKGIASFVASADLDLVIDCDAGIGLIGDGFQIERALLNLLSNSVKFTRPGGQITIRARSDGVDVAFAVRDTGRGIPLNDQDHLFKRFFRTTRSREQEVPGTGLGLYIVKQIVELHGGAMKVVSSPEGSEFTMLLPIGGPPADVLELDRSR